MIYKKIKLKYPEAFFIAKPYKHAHMETSQESKNPLQLLWILLIQSYPA